MSITKHQLSIIHQEESIIGCQLRYGHTIQLCNTTLRRARELYDQLSTLGEMVEQLREKLTTSWQAKEGCSREDADCTSGFCGCSYRDFAWFWGCLQRYRSIGNLFDETMHHYRDLRILCTHIIQYRMAMLLQDSDTHNNFIDTLVCLDELTNDERWVYLNIQGTLSGGPARLVLTLGRDDDVTKTWKFDYW